MADLFAVVDSGSASALPFCIIEHPCTPRGKGRPRGRIVKPRQGPAFISFYTDAETRQYEEALAWRARAKMKGRPPVEGPLAVRIFAMIPIPKSWPARDRDAALAGTKFPTTGSDCDNIAKSVLDAFNGIVFADDKQVVRVVVFKEYAEHPGVIAELYRLP